jgi:hypothetical protein
MACATKIQGFIVLKTHTRNPLLTPDCHEGFEKPLPIRCPASYDADAREGSIRREVAATLRQKSSTTSCL